MLNMFWLTTAFSRQGRLGYIHFECLNTESLKLSICFWKADG
uniref:Uncharacterized protein n=1 Tax=Anguilla anguilla TaxID=7936 RepID=A0A0E9WEJ7_ANGAN